MKRKSFLFVCNAFLALSFISPAFATNPIEESGNRFYLVAGGQAEMAISSLNNSNNIAVSLGAGYHFSRSFRVKYRGQRRSDRLDVSICLSQRHAR